MIRFADKLGWALGFMRLNAQPSFVLQTNEIMVRVTTPQILYVEKDKNYLVYHTRDGSYRIVPPSCTPSRNMYQFP